MRKFEPKRFIISKETKELLSIESLDKKLKVGAENNIILEFLSIYDNYSFIVSFNGVKQKGTICFKDSERYPLLHLKENNLYLRITKQEIVDYMWTSMGTDRVLWPLYGFTTDFKRNYVEE